MTSISESRMLIVSRAVNEVMLLGEHLEVQVTRLTRHTVKLRAIHREVGGRDTREIFSGQLSQGDRVDLGDKIAVQVMEIRPDAKVRLGFDAPKNVSVHRKEVFD